MLKRVGRLFLLEVKMQNRSKSVDTAKCCPTASWGKPRQISLLRTGAHAVSVSCCPIEIGEIEKAVSIPNNAAHEGEQACETVRSLALEGEESQKNIK